MWTLSGLKDQERSTPCNSIRSILPELPMDKFISPEERSKLGTLSFTSSVERNKIYRENDPYESQKF